MSDPRLESGAPRPDAEDAPPPSDPSSMTVLEHIAELRATLIWAFAFAFGAACIAWFFSDQIVDALLKPAHEAGQQTLYFQKPMEAFMLKLKASAVVGLFLVFPLILHRIYLFVRPGLLPKEKRVVTPLVVVSTLLFYGGVGFCFVVLLPLVIRFALGFATESLQPWLTAESYFDMAARLCFAFGILFELPMVVFVLSWIGLVDPRKLLRGWRYALVMILIASAVLTPPDVISQVMLAGPVMLLYMASVLVSILVRRRRDRERDLQRAQDEAEEAAERAAEHAAALARAREDAQRRKASEDDPDDDPDGDGGGPRRGPKDGGGGDPRAGAGPDQAPDVTAHPAPGRVERGADLQEAPDPSVEEGREDPPWVRGKPASTTDGPDGPASPEGGEERGPDDRDREDS